MNSLRTIGLIMALFVFSSCQGKPVAEQDLVGIYKFESPNSNGTLELRGDGSYIQKLTTRSGATKEAKGEWRYQPPLGGSVNRGTVRILGAIREREDKLEQVDPTFSVALSVYSSGSKLSLYASPDGNESYVKQ